MWPFGVVAGVTGNKQQHHVSEMPGSGAGSGGLDAPCCLAVGELQRKWELELP